MITNQFHLQVIAAIIATQFAAGSSFADNTPAEQAAQMLARVQTVDMKCSYLNAADKDALSNLVARAELALANRESVEATKAALQRGHDSGLAATCNANEKQSVIAILAAARQASVPQVSKSTNAVALTAPPIAADAASSPPAAPKGAVSLAQKMKLPAPTKIVEQQPVKPLAQENQPVQPKPQIAKPAQIAQAPRVTKPKPDHAAINGLQHYAQMTEAYYLALRCNGSSREASGLYASIVAEHGKQIQSHGAKEVSRVLRGAKSRSASQSCS